MSIKSLKNVMFAAAVAASAMAANADSIAVSPVLDANGLETAFNLTLDVSVGRKDGKPEIALPLEGGLDRIYPVGKIEVK